MFQILKQIGEIYGLVLIILMIISMASFIFFIIYKAGEWLYEEKEFNKQILKNTSIL